MRVVVAGGTGLIGRRLVAALVERGDEVSLLARSSRSARTANLPAAVRLVEADVTTAGPWQASLSECDAVVNLVGENVFTHAWTDDYKRRLRSSRVDSTQRIAEALAQAPRRPDGSERVWVNGSAIGYYGERGETECTEATPAGDDFLAKLCIDWEAATTPAAEAGVRVVLMRTGVVLDRAGGALPKLDFPIKLFLGGPIGPGTQWTSWIHHADMVGLILFALDQTSLAGPVNATAPHPARNRQLVAEIGRVLRRPIWLPAPSFALRLLLGERAKVVLASQRVLPSRALTQGYRFRFPELGPAIEDLYRSAKSR
jgi:uncharacterized protein (TIGR01777 family)